MNPGPDPQPPHPDLEPPAPDADVAAAVAAELDDLTQEAADQLDAAIETFLRNTGTRPNTATRAAARTILLCSRDYTDLTASPPMPKYPGLAGVIVVPIPDRELPPPPTTAQLDLALTEALSAHTLNRTSTACACGWSPGGASHTAHVVHQLVKVVDRYTAAWMFNAGLATGDVHRRRTEELDRAREIAVALEQELAAAARPAITYVRWLRSDPREARDFPPLQPTHPSASAHCPTCQQQLANGERVQLLVLGPGADPVEQAEHAKGAWYTATAVLAHTACVGPVPPGERSDGFHTIDELYEHRRALTAALTAVLPGLAWRSQLHHDGSMHDGMFIVGVELPGVGQVSYHYHLEHWDDFAHVHEPERAPAFDGHSPGDVVRRLLAWASAEANGADE